MRTRLTWASPDMSAEPLAAAALSLLSQPITPKAPAPVVAAMPSNNRRRLASAACGRLSLRFLISIHSHGPPRSRRPPLALRQPANNRQLPTVALFLHAVFVRHRSEERRVGKERPRRW